MCNTKDHVISLNSVLVVRETRIDGTVHQEQFIAKSGLIFTEPTISGFEETEVNSLEDLFSFLGIKPSAKEVFLGILGGAYGAGSQYAKAYLLTEGLEKYDCRGVAVLFRADSQGLFLANSYNERQRVELKFGTPTFRIVSDEIMRDVVHARYFGPDDDPSGNFVLTVTPK